MKHLINWVEIPAKDFKRAVKFYSVIFNDITFNEMPMGDAHYALFPSEDKFNAGAIVQGPHHIPSSDGIVIYFDGGKDMNTILMKVENAGGEVIMPKTFLGGQAGYVGMFIDTEGNKIGLQHL
jgi:predicted enzyme related to lactoylglutathione lyase